MTRLAAFLSLILLAAPAAAKPPIVVELYTAQGCGPCGDANSFVGKLADRPGVLPLTFAVDYWDYLGWADTFAKPEFAERQRAYVAQLALPEPYTPQVVVDGHAEASGQQTDKIEALLRAAVRAPRDPPAVAFIGVRRVDVGSARAPKGGGEVWLVRYDPRAREVEIKRGENRGQTMTQRNVVRQVVRLGVWKGRPTAYHTPASPEPGLATVVLVQAAEGGRMLAVASPPP